MKLLDEMTLLAYSLMRLAECVVPYFVLIRCQWCSTGKQNNVLKWSLMNELPVIGSLCLRTDFWDRHGANIATHKKEMYG